MHKKAKKTMRKYGQRLLNVLYGLLLLASPAVTQAATTGQITADPTTGLGLARTIGGLSIIVAGVVWAGSAIFGSEMEAKAKNQVLAVVKGILVIGTGTLILASLPGA